MIIHFTGSAQDLDRDLPFLRRIAKTIAQHGDELAREWTEPTALDDVKPATTETKDEGDWHMAVTADIDAISRADLVIIEATNDRFLQGYEIAMALQYKRPTLLVTREPLEQHAFSGVRDRLLTMAQYETEDELEALVKDFIRSNTITTKDLRFNMFIDRPIYNYLRNVSYETGKNKSEIIRDLINREINRKNG